MEPERYKGVKQMKINVNGIELFYEKNGSGRPLIMVHGNGEDHKIFYPSVVQLMDHFTVYTVDSRGHGESSKVSELHYTDMADDMVAFMDALDLKDVVFYGFSDGGIIGLLAAMKTDRIGMLITSGANMTPQGVSKPLQLFVKAAYKVTRDPKMRLMMAEPNLTSADLAKIKVPTVVIAGEKDIIKADETANIAASIPGAKLRIIAGEGHGSYIVGSKRIGEIIMEETGVAEGPKYVTPEQLKILIGAQKGELDAVFMYERLANVVKDEKDAAAFRRLASDEQRHADVFRRYTGKDYKPNPTKAIAVPTMYKVLGKEKVYPIIADAEYAAADKYKNIIADFPEVEQVMNDETHHGDAVLGLLE